MQKNIDSKDNVSFFTKLMMLINSIREYKKTKIYLPKSRNLDYFKNLEYAKVDFNKSKDCTYKWSLASKCDKIARQKYEVFKKEMINDYKNVKRQKRKKIIEQIKNLI